MITELPLELFKNTPDIILTGVAEGNRYGSLRPKIVELKAIKDIPDLQLYQLKIGSYNTKLSDSEQPLVRVNTITSSMILIMLVPI